MKLFLLGFALFLLASTVASRNECYGGLHHPKVFKIQSQRPGAGSAKTQYDTLHYRTLTTITPDFAVNSGCGSYGADQHQINIASNPHGGFLCAWNDDRAGDRQVNAQLFDNSGNRIGPMFHVSEGNANWNSEPHVTFNPKTDEYIVLWAGTGYDIELQRISASGEVIGHNIPANQFYSTNTNNPSAATDSSGNIVVTWTADVTCCMTEIPYCRIFGPDGVPITDQWPLDPFGKAPLSSGGWDDRIATDSTGRCIIVWSGFVNGRSRIVLQSVNRTANLYAEPVIVSDPADSTNYYFPTVTSVKGGHFLILWGSDDGVYGRIFHPDSGFVTSQITITHLPNSWITYCASSDNRNTFFITWFSDQPHGLILSTQGQLAGPGTVLAFSSAITWWDYPRLSKATDGRVFLSYGGYVRTQRDVMLQAFDVSFHPIGSSVKVADDGCSAWQTNPVGKYNRDGKSLIVWEDQRNGYHDLYGQVLDASGHPLSDNMQINDSTTLHWTSAPSVIADNDGNFLVAFAGGEASNRNLIVQRVSASGVLMGVNRQITADVYNDYDEMRNVIQNNEAGDILVCWYPSATYPVYARRLHKDLTMATTQVIVFRGSSSSPKLIRALAANSRFHILVSWVEYNSSTFTQGNVLKAMVLDEQGRVLRDTLVVAASTNERSIQAVVCRIDDNDNMVFVWSDYDTDGYDSRLHVNRLYALDGAVRTDSVSIDNFNTRMHIIAFTNKLVFVAWDASNEIRAIMYNDNLHTYAAMQLTPVEYSPGKAYCADLYLDNLLVTYENSQNSDLGREIHAIVQRLDGSTFQFIPPSHETTSSVFPNPSSQSVQLWYEITHETHVTIGVYNILGQKVATIEDAVRPPGTYTVKFPTTRLAAGTYFVFYHGAQSFARKFIVIKSSAR
jgi:hypothetical protein